MPAPRTRLSGQIMSRDTVISTVPGKDLGAHFHVGYSSKTTLTFYTANREVSIVLLTSLVLLLSGDTEQPESTFSCMFKVTY